MHQPAALIKRRLFLALLMFRGGCCVTPVVCGLKGRGRRDGSQAETAGAAAAGVARLR